MNIQGELKHKADSLAKAIGCEEKEVEILTNTLNNMLDDKKLGKTSKFIEAARSDLSYNELLVSFGVLCRELIKHRDRK